MEGNTLYRSPNLTADSPPPTVPRHSKKGSRRLGSSLTKYGWVPHQILVSDCANPVAPSWGGEDFNLFRYSTMKNSAIDQSIG